MGKSPGKWIKTVLFGKKSSKSNLSKDASLEKKISISSKTQSKDFGADPMVISSPIDPVTNVSGEHAELENSPSANLACDTVDNVSSVGPNAANDHDVIRLEQAATKAQAAFRGYLARRAFWALKGIIRLQALVRGHLVRRQAVATLSCMRAIVEFQALVRGQRVRRSWNGPQVLRKNTSGEPLKRADLLGTSLCSEKLSTNALATKLVASSNTTTPLSLQYDPVEPNSVRNWLERWSSSHFWEPLPQAKKPLNPKPKRKQTKPLSEEPEPTKPKRNTRRIPTVNLDNNPSNPSENEKPKRNTRKTSTHQAEPVQEPVNELEKVKRSLKKIAVSETEKVNDVSIAMPEHEPEPERAEPDALLGPPLVAEPLDINRPVDLVKPNRKVESENVDSNGKENSKTRRRKSFPAKQEYQESVSQNTPALPSYMAATESAKAKLRAQAAAKAAEDGGDGGFVRRHSLPSATVKLSLQSPRVQKPLQVNGKGGTKSNKLQISPRDEKAISSGWRR